MKQRCSNPKAKQYHDYGGRGIDVFHEWLNSYEKFRDYVISLPDYNKPMMTLDRIDNNKDYEPGNLRWTTWHIQAINKRKTSTTSGYVGVSWSKERKKWVASLWNNDKIVGLGRHKSIIDAIEARNNYIIKNELFEYPIQEYHG